MSFIYEHSYGLTILALFAIPAFFLALFIFLAKSGKAREASELEGFPKEGTVIYDSLTNSMKIASKGEWEDLEL